MKNYRCSQCYQNQQQNTKTPSTTLLLGFLWQLNSETTSPAFNWTTKSSLSKVNPVTTGRAIDLISKLRSLASLDVERLDISLRLFGDRSNRPAHGTTNHLPSITFRHCNRRSTGLAFEIDHDLLTPRPNKRTKKTIQVLCSIARLRSRKTA